MVRKLVVHVTQPLQRVLGQALGFVAKHDHDVPRAHLKVHLVRIEFDRIECLTGAALGQLAQRRGGLDAAARGARCQIEVVLQPGEQCPRQRAHALVSLVQRIVSRAKPSACYIEAVRGCLDALEPRLFAGGKSDPAPAQFFSQLSCQFGMPLKQLAEDARIAGRIVAGSKVSRLIDTE